MDLSRLRQFQLNTTTDIKPFRCDDEDLTEFLFEDAKHSQKELMAVTYLLEYMERNQTVAYYSLLADKITFNPDEKGVWNKINRKIPNSKRRKSYPAVKIGRPAVNVEYAGDGIGTFILDKSNTRSPISSDWDAASLQSMHYAVQCDFMKRTDSNSLPRGTRKIPRV